jgi:formylglycine-generating enzyme required for sulfatase activity
MGEGNDAHQQCFDEPFWIDRYEVTNRQYGSCGTYCGDDLPRESVNWFDARDFCASRGARLPTEREWEYAARGVSNWVYPWGNEFVSSNARYGLAFLATEATARVGTHPAGVSWVGAHDMAGNVWEWVSSLYMPYPFDSDDGRESIRDIFSVGVMRGGTFLSHSDALRAPERGRINNFFFSNYSGFRCARDA